MAVELQQSLGVVTALGLAERPSLELAMGKDADPTGQARDLLRRHGAGALVAEAKGSDDEGAAGGHYELPDEWLRDGDHIVLAGRRLAVVATPGHTAGHVVFHDAAHGLLLAGDHILPTITPSIGFEPVLRPSPLRDFLASLERTLALPDALLLPAHGGTGRRAHERAHELLEHHEDRLAVILAALRRGENNAAHIAAAVPWTRHLRRLDQLTAFNRMLAVLETVHHLVLLEDRGLAASRVHRGHLMFHASA